jgi:predicted alpha/beta-hydrolase family hydrolase
MSRIEPFLEASTAGFLHIPSEPLDQALVLTHGAGGNCQAPLLVSVADAFADAGFHVLRCDLAFRKRKRAGPPHPSQSAEDRNGLLADLLVMRGFVSGRILLGGHSYGGRQASILVSENSSACDALLLLSYPLHPPEKPNQLRTAHFTGLKTPSLFVHGAKDPFGTLEEFHTALKLIFAPVELSIVENAGHDLSRGRFDIPSLVIEPMRKLIEGL